MRFPALKENLFRLGAWVPPKGIHYANGVLNYLNLGRWFRDRGIEIPVRLNGREPLYEQVAKLVKEPAAYLEFGVFNGSSMRFWSKLLKHPDSFLHGFDSFEGLPEDWKLLARREDFCVENIPVFDDPRIKLFKGWFSDTVPKYAAEFRRPPNLVMHLDADLYSSTATVFKEMRRFIGPGTILIFDELFDREHELKAFTEYLDSGPIKVECLGGTRSLTQAAFRVLAT
jgi:hypothetical protein